MRKTCKKSDECSLGCIHLPTSPHTLETIFLSTSTQDCTSQNDSPSMFYLYFCSWSVAWPAFFSPGFSATSADFAIQACPGFLPRALAPDSAPDPPSAPLARAPALNGALASLLFSNTTGKPEGFALGRGLRVELCESVPNGPGLHGKASENPFREQ